MTTIPIHVTTQVVDALPWEDFRRRAALNPRRIILADGEDPRVIQAAVTLNSEKIASTCLIGSRRRIETLWKKYNGPQALDCVDPQGLEPSQAQSLADLLITLPKYRRLSTADSLQSILDPLTLGCLLLKTGQGDGFMGGAARTTSDTLRAVLSIIGLSDQARVLFGLFLMEPRASLRTALVLLADCAVIPDPSSKQLAQIALGAAEAFRFFLRQEPRVAFLSFSTLGSAIHPLVDKVREAHRLAREKAPGALLEGEWQADAALDLFSAQIKGAGKSPMAGNANVLIAPDLNCGNIAYKLAQRLGGCRAVGPVLWGTSLPANDLSRGCSTEDAIDMAALTALQAQAFVKKPVTALSTREALK